MSKGGMSRGAVWKNLELALQIAHLWLDLHISPTPERPYAGFFHFSANAEYLRAQIRPIREEFSLAPFSASLWDPPT
eukprot:445713-Prorocentrum_minimum.AAC.1